MNVCITYTTNIYSLLSVLGIFICSFLLDVLVCFFNLFIQLALFWVRSHLK